MKRKHSILFLTLNIFSQTGGIEKVCKIIGKALSDLQEDLHFQLQVYSLHEDGKQFDNKYFSRFKFKGFKGNIPRMIISSLLRKRYPSNIIILSHINLLIVGYIIKSIFPKTKLLLLAHGIEVWNIKSSYKKRLLKHCDQILAVSKFTADILIAENNISKQRISILNNSLDPFLASANEANVLQIKQSLGFKNGDIIMLAVTRYSNKEKYKGYDKVLEVMKGLVKVYPQLKYLLVGKYDPSEKLRIDGLVSNYGLNEHVVFTGFVSNETLADYFCLSSFFVMPSEKEGFGLVFIEAMYYNLPVIAGNKDGSVDALLNGRLGTLIDIDDNEALKESIVKHVLNLSLFKPNREILLRTFGYETYREKWRNIVQQY